MLKSVRGDGVWPHDLSDSFSFDGPKTVIPKQAPNLDSLSKTDIEMLDRSFAERGHFTFKEFWEEAHRDPAFLRSKKHQMTEEDLTEDDPILLEHLKEVQENEWFLQAWRYLPPRDEEALGFETPSEGPCHNSGRSGSGTSEVLRDYGV
jgi:hypothetical protein